MGFYNAIIASCLIFVVLCIVYFLVYAFGPSNEEEKREKIKQEEEKQRIKKEREKIEQKIFDYASEQGKNDIRDIYSSMDLHYSKALNYATTYVLTLPQKPTYTEGVIKGSLADNIAVVANAEKKKEYEKKVEEHNQYIEKFRVSKDAYLDFAGKMSYFSWRLPDEYKECKDYLDEKISKEKAHLKELEKTLRDEKYKLEFFVR